MKFIYVFDEDTRKKMLDMGFKALKSDDKNGIYVFKNPDLSEEHFAKYDFEVILSNVLTF